MFVPLWKVFRQRRQDHKQTYRERLACSKVLDFEIREFNHNEAYAAFYYYPEELVRLFERISEKNLAIQSLLRRVPPIMLRQFGLSCIVDEVQSTSAVEGIHSTQRELKETLESLPNSQHFSSIIKKYNHLISQEDIPLTTCEDVRRLYEEFAHDEVIRDNPNDKLDGRLFRANTVDIVSSSGKTLHRGLSPEEKIIEAVQFALNFLYDETVPSLVRIAVFHYLFVYIHPFYNGNGRTARFISSYQLSKVYHYLPALRLSLNIKRRRTAYYRLIRDTDSEINCGDLTTFIYGFTKMILSAFEDVESVLERKLKQLERFRAKIPAADSLTRLLYDVLLQGCMFFGQGVSMSDLIQLTGKSRNTIKSKLDSLPVIVRREHKHFYKLNLFAISFESPPVACVDILTHA